MSSESGVCNSELQTLNSELQTLNYELNHTSRKHLQKLFHGQNGITGTEKYQS